MKEDRFLQQRNDVYYFRMKIPADLRNAFQGRREFKRSLRTHTQRKALPLARKWAHRADELFYRLRMGMMTKQQMEQLVENFAKWQVDRAEEARSLGIGKPLFIEDLDIQLDALRQLIQTRSQDLKNGDIARFEVEVDAILRNSGLSVDSPSEYQKLCKLLFRKTIELDKAELARREQSYAEDYAAMEKELCRYSVVEPEQSPPSPNPVAGNTSQVLPKNESSILLSAAIDLYINHLKTTRHEELVSINEYHGILKSFMAIIGDMKIELINITIFTKYAATLKSLPSRHHIIKIFQNKSIDEKIKMVIKAKKLAEQKKDESIKIPTTSLSTIKKHIGLVKSFLDYLETYNYIPKNPASKFIYKGKKSKPEDEERNAFTKQELQTMIDILAEEKAKGKFIDYPEKYWISLIGPLSGIRENEICQLHIEDIILDDGIWCFDINEKNETKRVKNHEKRKVPVHPVLIDLGFIDYFEKVKAQGKPRLWMKLPYNKANGYYKSYGRWFNGEKRVESFKRKFISSPNGRVLDFHSFRHSFITDFKHRLVDELLIEALVGHKHGQLAYDRYGKRFLTRILFEELKK